MEVTHRHEFNISFRPGSRDHIVAWEGIITPERPFLIQPLQVV